MRSLGLVPRLHRELSRADLVDRLAGLVDAARRVAIDGPDASGKTGLADELAAALRGRGRSVVRASIDDFLRPPAERYRRGPDSPEGYYDDSFDYGAAREFVLARTDDAVVLFDGVFLLRPELRDVWDFHVFVSVGFEEILRRALRRDVARFGSRDEVERRYRVRYIPAQQLYLATARPELAADAIVYNDDPSSPWLSVRTPS